MPPTVPWMIKKNKKNYEIEKTNGWVMGFKVPRVNKSGKCGQYRAAIPFPSPPLRHDQEKKKKKTEEKKNHHKPDLVLIEEKPDAFHIPEADRLGEDVAPHRV